MSKLLRQNVGGTDYTMVGCTLSATCATAAATAAKVATLTDGDTLADGMSVSIQFTNGNTAASPLTLTVGGATANICDSRGQNIGGNIWQAGNVVTFLYTFGKFLLLNCVVDEVTLNNMNSVSSNAVLRMSSLSIPTFVNEDVFVRAENCPLDRVSFFRVFEASANSPYGSGGNDFCYYVNRVVQDGFIHITAFDVRRNVTYANSKIDGTWGTWQSLAGTSDLVLNPLLPNAIYKASRSGNVVMVYVHHDSVPVAQNTRTSILEGLPAPVQGIVPQGIIDWGGLSTVANTEISSQGVFQALGNQNTPQSPATVNVTVDSVITYICA